MQYSKSTVILAAFIGAAAAQTAYPWGQCGGIGYNGPTVCTPGWVCTKENDYFSNCFPYFYPSWESCLATATSTSECSWPGDPTAFPTTTIAAPTGPVTSVPATTTLVTVTTTSIYW